MLGRFVIVGIFGAAALVCAWRAGQAIRHRDNGFGWMLGAVVCAFMVAWSAFG